MREIEFRGKCVLNNEWVYGYYAPVYLYEKDGKERSTYCIVSPNTIEKIEMLGCGVQSGLPATYEIDENTVGQYTGLKDKNGTKIFEGDILMFNKGRKLPNYVHTPRLIKWHQGDCAFETYPYGKALTVSGSGALIQPDMMIECEVIGNIYDDKDLLKEKQ